MELKLRNDRTRSNMKRFKPNLNKKFYLVFEHLLYVKLDQISYMAKMATVSVAHVLIIWCFDPRSFLVISTSRKDIGPVLILCRIIDNTRIGGYEARKNKSTIFFRQEK